MGTEVKRFGDLIPPPLDCDEKINVEAILDTDVLWVEFQELSGEKGDFFWIIVQDVESKRKLGFSCGGKVLMKKLVTARDKGYLPLIGKLVKVKQYYDIL